MGRKLFYICCAFVMVMINAPTVFAQEASKEDAATAVKAEVKSDKEAIKTEKETIKEHAQVAKVEEGQLRQQIKEAMAKGDKETANKLREQLRATHKENMKEKKQDTRDLRHARKELRQDTKAARKQGLVPPRK